MSAGDHNVCMNENDSLNRNNTKNEKSLADTINSNNKITKLVDAYRLIHKNGGYTWKRGIIYSRLDCIFVSASLIRNINKAEYDWSFETSDHAAAMISLTINDSPV